MTTAEMHGNPLTTRDSNVLEKLKNPEANPDFVPVVDDGLPGDPGCSAEVYTEASAAERGVMMRVQTVEMKIMVTMAVNDGSEFLDCLKELDGLVERFPGYSSVRNNRVQMYRRLYGDNLLLSIPDTTNGLIKSPEPKDLLHAATIVLQDLNQIMTSLLPEVLTTPISTRHKNVLSSASTQRAILYHTTAKNITTQTPVCLPEAMLEATWTKADFETAASRDFAIGGFYGNEMAKGMAVATNPTAKLCGQIVSEAMKKEYGMYI